MRYYCFVLNTSAEKIKEHAKIELQQYAYENTLAAMNNYVFKNIKNDVCFFAHREEGNAVFAAFSYNERRSSFQEAYEHILGILEDVFLIKRIKAYPDEITMFDYLESLLEARRREYMNMSNRLVESSNLWIYHYYHDVRRPCTMILKKSLSQKSKEKNI